MSINKLKMKGNKTEVFTIVSANKLQYGPSSTTFTFFKKAFVSLQLDYCNSLDYCLLHKLQRAQTKAAHVFCRLQSLISFDWCQFELELNARLQYLATVVIMALLQHPHRSYCVSRLLVCFSCPPLCAVH